MPADGGGSGRPLWENEPLSARSARAGHLFCSSASEGSAPRSCLGQSAAGRPLCLLSGGAGRAAPGLPGGKEGQLEPQAHGGRGTVRTARLAHIRDGTLPRPRQGSGEPPCAGPGSQQVCRGTLLMVGENRRPPAVSAGKGRPWQTAAWTWTMRGAHACRGPVDESACPARGAQTHPRCTGREEARSPPHPLMWPWCWVWRVRIKHCITRVRVLGRPSMGPVPAPLPTPSHRGGLTPAEHIPCRVTQGGLVSSGPARDGAGHAERLTAEERAAGPGPRQPCPPRRYDGPFRKRNLYLRARAAVLFPSVKVSQMDFPALALRAAKCWAFLFSLHPVNLGLN